MDNRITPNFDIMLGLRLMIMHLYFTKEVIYKIIDVIIDLIEIVQYPKDYRTIFIHHQGINNNNFLVRSHCKSNILS
jgi:hypothetical protein